MQNELLYDHALGWRSVHMTGPELPKTIWRITAKDALTENACLDLADHVQDSLGEMTSLNFSLYGGFATPKAARLCAQIVEGARPQFLNVLTSPNMDVFLDALPRLEVRTMGVHLLMPSSAIVSVLRSAARFSRGKLEIQRLEDLMCPESVLGALREAFEEPCLEMLTLTKGAALDSVLEACSAGLVLGSKLGVFGMHVVRAATLTKVLERVSSLFLTPRTSVTGIVASGTFPWLQGLTLDECAVPLSTLMVIVQGAPRLKTLYVRGNDCAPQLLRQMQRTHGDVLMHWFSSTPRIALSEFEPFRKLVLVSLGRAIHADEQARFLAVTRSPVFLNAGPSCDNVRWAAYGNRNASEMPGLDLDMAFCEGVRSSRSCLLSFLGSQENTPAGRFTARDGDHALLRKVFSLLLPLWGT